MIDKPKKDPDPFPQLPRRPMFTGMGVQPEDAAGFSPLIGDAPREQARKGDESHKPVEGESLVCSSAADQASVSAHAQNGLNPEMPATSRRSQPESPAVVSNASGGDAPRPSAPDGGFGGSRPVSVPADVVPVEMPKPYAPDLSTTTVVRAGKPYEGESCFPNQSPLPSVPSSTSLESLSAQSSPPSSKPKKTGRPPKHVVKPWEVEGISRALWYKRQKAGK